MVKLTTSRGLNRQLAEIRLLEGKVQGIEGGVGEVTTQSSETWHDNAPYSVLVEDLRLANIRLGEAHGVLRGCEVREYPTTLSEERVGYGTRVRFRIDGKPDELCFVGYGETDMDNGFVLYDCPLAKLLVGRLKGEVFKGTINGRTSTYTIDQVRPVEKL